MEKVEVKLWVKGECGKSAICCENKDDLSLSRQQPTTCQGPAPHPRLSCVRVTTQLTAV